MELSTLFHNNIQTERIAHYLFLNFLLKMTSTQTLALPENYVKIFKNQMLPLKPLYNILHFINILLSPNIFTF